METGRSSDEGEDSGWADGPAGEAGTLFGRFCQIRNQEADRECAKKRKKKI